jgi:hypothetical protein
MDEKQLNRRQILGGVAVTAATAGLVGQAVPAARKRDISGV